MYYPDQQIGQYTIRKPLGRGPFTNVYQGQLSSIQAPIIAIKVPSQDSSAITALLQRRLTISSRLKSVHVLESRVLNMQGPITTADYVAQGSLRDHISAGNSYDVAFIVGCVAQIADTLDYAHNEGVVHGNLKPENILFDEHGSILLSDFDVPSIPFQQSSLVLQNLGYVAPEQYDGRTLPASDQYQLACLTMEWLLAQSTAPSVPDPMVDTIQQVIKKAQASNVTQRYPTVRDFAESLRIACGLRPIVNGPSSAPTTPTQTRWRTPLLIAATLFLLAILVVGSFLTGQLIKHSITSTSHSTASTAFDPLVLYNSVVRSKATLDNPSGGDGVGHWSLLGDRFGNSCVFANQILHIKTTMPTEVNCFINNLTVHDFAFQVGMQFLQISPILGDLEAGLLLRNDQTTGTGYRFFLNTAFYTCDFAAEILKPTSTSCSTQRGVQATNVLTVIARQDTFYLYINNTYVGPPIKDARYVTGKLGVFLTANDNTKMDVAFKNVKIWIE